MALSATSIAIGGWTFGATHRAVRGWVPLGSTLPRGSVGTAAAAVLGATVVALVPSGGADADALGASIAPLDRRGSASSAPHAHAYSTTPPSGTAAVSRGTTGTALPISPASDAGADDVGTDLVSDLRAGTATKSR